MPTLAINTSANFVSLAVLEEMSLLAEMDSRTDYQHRSAATSGLPAGHGDQLPPGYTRKRSKRGQRSSRVFAPGASVMLAPMLKQLLHDAKLKMSDLNLICLDIGPGMFTGLRVAVVTAKALVYATGADLIAVNTLAAIAAQTFEGLKPEDPMVTKRTVSVATNAQRQQLFTGTFRWQGEWEVEPLGDSETTVPQSSGGQIQTRQQWLSQLDSQVIATGMGLKPLAGDLARQFPQLTVAPPELRELKASSVGRVAWKKLQLGHRDDLWDLTPAYFRPSAAEEKRAGT
jgi:tRNA threonylcarbamoyladenosine biosynthesis protein TsaB